MMRALIFLGSLLLPLHWAHAEEASLPPPSLYEHMLTITLQELQIDRAYSGKAEPVVGHFAANLESDETFVVLPADVDLALQHSPKLCEEKPYRRTLGFDLTCTDFEGRLTRATKREVDVRTLGRDLLRIAASYTIPVSGYPGRSQYFTNLLTIWHGGDGTFEAASTEESGRLEQLEAAIKALGEELEKLRLKDGEGEIINEEQFIAAVWRYQFGYLYVQEESAEQNPDGLSGPGTERQYLFKRWPVIEQHLETVHTLLRTGLSPSVLEDFRDALSANVIVWRSKDDAGLHWEIPLEPVLPSLDCSLEAAMGNSEECYRGVILGGIYPPPLPKADGYCSLSFMKETVFCGYEAPAADEGGDDEGDVDDEDGEGDEEGEPIPPVTSESREEASECPEIPGDACSLDTTREFTNTIRNESCFMRQCLRESFRDHRLLPGRSTHVTQDQSFPWDSCIGPDPQLAGLMTPPPDLPIFSLIHLPPYRLDLILKHIDMSTCQVSALPPMPPPACGFDARSRLYQPLESVYDTTMSLSTQAENYRASTVAMQSLSEALGSRFATTLYADFAERSLPPIDDRIHFAAALLEELSRVTFPTLMCPFNASYGDALCTPSSPTTTPPPNPGSSSMRTAPPPAIMRPFDPQNPVMRPFEPLNPTMRTVNFVNPILRPVDTFPPPSAPSDVTNPVLTPVLGLPGTGL
ncbi:MAG: hypothetical protein Q7R81_06875 [Candidatus Peregrinibacteria bacterium]|nr:hypothetical protein [Candidatus Peregrinibacteria bacterium]